MHVNTFDTGGGAARAAYRLHTGLRQLGHASKIIVAEQRLNDPTITAVSDGFSRKVWRRLRWRYLPLRFVRYWISRPTGYTLFSSDCMQSVVNWQKQLSSCNIVNLHWVAQFINYRAFFAAVPNLIPVVWTLHDMNAFTGGCHTALECENYVKNCGACPQLGSNNPRDVSYKLWQYKREIYHRIKPGRLHIVTPSRWLAAQVQRSSLLHSFDVSVIPNSLDTAIFAPQDQWAARDKLGISQETNVILFVANSITIKHKGFSYLLRALHNLQDIFLVSLGGDAPQIEASIPHLHLGRITDNHQMAQAYSAADIFVISSLQENLPNTVMESLACGTPVIGFSVGGIPDMVRPGITGWLVPPKDADGLGAVITQAFQEPSTLEQMAINCRRIAVQEYALEVQAQKYSELYHKMMHDEKNSPHH
ncbi:MAG: glycosyltransferase [Chloroflexi bacterium]|nr:glycosyltransferase [Chloroflexota bacterium]